jgi:sugar O-acyltransferase (sialic acid O-acetyltransferase NeuD family)
MTSKELVIIAYSGHSFVCIDNALLNGYSFLGYCDNEEKKNNPFSLNYLGVEDAFFSLHIKCKRFIGIGNNKVRQIVYNKFSEKHYVNLIHPKSIIADSVKIIANSNLLINAGVIVNSLVVIGKGVILNSACVIEHECEIADFVHIAPGAVLAGGVKVGERTFIGANSVVKQGVRIGADVIIGAGSVIVNDIPSGQTIVGNPGRILNKNN